MNDFNYTYIPSSFCCCLSLEYFFSEKNSTSCFCSSYWEQPVSKWRKKNHIIHVQFKYLFWHNRKIEYQLLLCIYWATFLFILSVSLFIVLLLCIFIFCFSLCVCVVSFFFLFIDHKHVLFCIIRRRKKYTHIYIHGLCFFYVVWKEILKLRHIVSIEM